MKTSARLKRSLASILSAAMLLTSVFGNASLTPVSAEDGVTTHGNWEISKDSNGINIANWSDSDFYYHSKTDFKTGTTGAYFNKERKEFNYVASTGSNGKESKGIVQTNNTDYGYCDYKADASGVLSVYIKAAVGKTFYLSKKDKTGDSSAVANFEMVSENAAEKYSEVEGVEITPSDDEEAQTLKIDIDCEAGSTYYMCVSGSKVYVYGIEEDMASINLSGEITGEVDKLPKDYSISFIDEEDNEYEATRSDNSYSVTLRPGDYTATVKGASGYTVSKESKDITVGSDSEQSHDIEIVENDCVTMSGNVKGVDEDYDLSDLGFTFIPEDS
nr:hypothetical protein [Lachnospiraceae bacterium]